MSYNFPFDPNQNYLKICYDAGFTFGGEKGDLADVYNSDFGDCFTVTVIENSFHVDAGPSLCLNSKNNNYYCPHNKAAFEAEVGDECSPVLQN